MYMYQVKKQLSYIFLATLILQNTSPIIAMQAAKPAEMPSFAWKLAPLIAVAGSFIGLKVMQAKREKVAKEMQAQLPKEIQNLVGEYAMPDSSKRILKHTIKLLPTIMPVEKVTFNSALDHLFKLHAEKNSALQNMPEYDHLKAHIEELNKYRSTNTVIALHATVIAPGNGHSVDILQFDLLGKQQHDPNNLLIKDETALHAILGHPLLPGQAALVSYSDGDLRIELTEDDKEKLASLSDEQVKFLDSLYSTKRSVWTGNPTLLVTSSQYWKLNRLFDRGQRNCIKEFYRIRFNDRRFVNDIANFGLGAVCVATILTFMNCMNRSERWSLWSENWDLRYENLRLREHLGAHKIPLPE